MFNLFAFQTKGHRCWHEGVSTVQAQVPRIGADRNCGAGFQLASATRQAGPAAPKGSCNCANGQANSKEMDASDASRYPLLGSSRAQMAPSLLFLRSSPPLRGEYDLRWKFYRRGRRGARRGRKQEVSALLKENEEVMKRAGKRAPRSKKGNGSSQSGARLAVALSSQ